MELMAEMNEYLSGEAQANAPAEITAEDEDTLPFETLDCFSTDPVGFSEMALKLMERVDHVFDRSVRFNRHSSQYLRSFAQLEKGIKYLGSLCITKFALEEKNHSFPELGQLSTSKLYRMASFHYRKLDAALSEHSAQKNEIDDARLDMFYRCFNLLQRLRSTETKIYRFHMNNTFKDENYDPVINGLAFSDKSWTRNITNRHCEPPAFRLAPAFSMLEIQDTGTAPSSEVRAQLTGEIVSSSSAGDALSAGSSVSTEETAAAFESSDGALVRQAETSSVAPVQGVETYSGEADAVPGFGRDMRREDRLKYLEQYSPEPVDYESILKQAAERGKKDAEASGEAGPVYLFKEDELRQLSLDPGFFKACPDLYEIVCSAYANLSGPPPEIG